MKKATTWETGYFNEKNLAAFREALDTAKENVKSGKDLKVRISDGNSKMGKVASVSLLPYITCPARCHHTCAGKCYAAKLCAFRKESLNAYAHNTALAMLNPDLFWKQVDAAAAVNRFFRFHVSGDILNADYFNRMVNVAINNPHCEILCFTKRYEIVNAWIDENGALPENLHLLFSAWTGLQPVNPHSIPETNVFGGSKKNFIEPSEDWKLCGGNCETCACRGVGCWQAKQGDTIAFKLH